MIIKTKESRWLLLLEKGINQMNDHRTAIERSDLHKLEITDDLIRTYAEATRDKWEEWLLTNDSRALPYWFVPVNATITYENNIDTASYCIEANIENSSSIYRLNAGDLIIYNPIKKSSMIIDAGVREKYTNE